MVTQDTTLTRLYLLYNISRELTTALDLRSVLERILFLSTHHAGAEQGSLIILDEHGEPIDAAIVYENRLIPHTVPQLKATLEHGLAGWAVRNRQPALISNTNQDERWLPRQFIDTPQPPDRSAICVPIQAQEQMVGVITLVHKSPGTFTNEHLELLQSIADQSSIFIRNVRLFVSLQATQKRYRELFEDSIDPIFITNTSGRILEVNRQAALVTGCSQKELVGSDMGSLHTINHELLGESFEKLNTEQTILYEAELKTSCGVAIPIEVHVRRISFEEVQLLQWMLRDITASKELDALREDLTAMIYHDLRSPLGNIITSLDMLSMTLPADLNPVSHSIFTVARRSSERMQRLISSLLDINRLEAGQPITNQQEINAENLIKEAIDTIQSNVESKGQSLVTELSPALPTLRVDVDMIRRVLINLLENANKFTPMNGSIQVGGSMEGEYIKIWVLDTGPGIPQEALEYIFEKFARLQTERSPKGLGLGLAFCRLAVQAHHGKIWAESQEGKGSRFVFILPAAAPA